MDKKVTLADLKEAFENSYAVDDTEVVKIAEVGNKYYAVFSASDGSSFGLVNNLMSFNKKTGEFKTEHPFTVGIDKLQKGLIWSKGKDNEVEHSATAAGKDFLKSIF